MSLMMGRSINISDFDYVGFQVLDVTGSSPRRASYMPGTVGWALDLSVKNVEGSEAYVGIDGQANLRRDLPEVLSKRLFDEVRLVACSP